MSTTPSTSPRVTRKRARARAAIIDAARELVLRDGYENLTMEGLAAEADVSKPSLYYYFSSKEAVVGVLAQATAEASVEAMIEALEKADRGPATIRALVRAYIDSYIDALNLFRVEYVYGQTVPIDATSDDVDAVMIDLFARIESRLAEDAAAGLVHEGLDLRRTAVVIWTSAHGLMSALSVLAHAGSNLTHSVDAMTDELCGVLVRGIYR